MNYYPHHIGDYLRDTAHLSLLEHGAYRRLLDVYYATEKPLPVEKAKVYRLVNAETRPERQAVDSVLSEFFHDTPDGWRNARADREIASWQDKSGKSKYAAGKRWGNATASPNAQRTHMRPHSEGISGGNANQSQSQNQSQIQRGDVHALVEVAGSLLKRPARKFD